MKMRVAVAFILLVSLAMAFTIEKERPVYEDEPDRPGLDEPFTNDENEEHNQVIDRFLIDCRNRYVLVSKLFNWFKKSCDVL